MFFSRPGLPQGPPQGGQKRAKNIREIGGNSAPGAPPGPWGPISSNFGGKKIEKIRPASRSASLPGGQPAGQGPGP